MLELGVKILIAYLLGTLLGSLILGRLRGVDIRSMGSGNAGATNALRTQGKLFGFLVLAIDIAKGMIAVWWLPSAALPGIDVHAGVSREWLMVACGLAVIVGHVYPVWFDFRGGKGAATVVGVVAAMELRLLVPLLLSWIIVLLLSGYVGLATMLSTIALTAAVLLLEPDNIPLCTFCAAGSGVVIFNHRHHIPRLLAGQDKTVRAALAVRVATALRLRLRRVS